ncbi:putative sulfate exporter family transporter [Arthrobacter sp. MYb227]|uniref:YeiH family protein n=1 Tax=Arthrobacter sp. MYb227 TaxID=1848601 RepID=UPI000CFCBC53|nr:putative sulfate exporter family transporter [Arthrobacter sp. MYb227]PQZ94732.1 putative sulfate exporter family transporter [Arthrobacter sp. MYb227]
MSKNDTSIESQQASPASVLTPTSPKPGAGSKLRGMAPGLLACIIGGVVAMGLAKLIPGMSALLIAILLGAIWRNLLPVPDMILPGVAVSSKKLLRTGIVLLGLQLALSQILALGPGVLLVVVLCVGITFGLTLLIGGWLGIDLPQRLLIAAGFSICGAAAVAATEGATKAKQDQVATAIGLVVLFGTLMIPIVPALGALLGMEDDAIGMLIGASTHEVAQVVAAGGAVSSSALAVAVTVKLARVVTLAPMIAGVSMYMNKKHAVEGAKKPPIVPLFVLGFIAMMLVRTTGILPDSVLEFAKLAQTFLLAAAMFGLGLGVHIKSLMRSGSRSLVLAALSTLIILGVAVAGTMLFPPAG